jgi:hypothetical protein
MAIDSYKFVDFATRQIMKAWAARQEPGMIPFAPLRKPLRECTVALLSSAGIARSDDRPFDQDGERRTANSPAGCGLVGALDIGCDGPVRTEPTTWGGLKARYR